jgi:hypothetical protein
MEGPQRQNGTAAPVEGPQRRNGTAALRDNASQSRMAESPPVPLDWKGVLQRVEEEFGAGRCPEGLQKGFD